MTRTTARLHRSFYRFADGRHRHAAGTDREAAERLAHKITKETVGRDDGNRSLTFGAYLTQRWLPAKKIELAPTTFHGYQRIVQLHVLPSLGKINIRRLTPDQLEALYTRKLDLFVIGLDNQGTGDIRRALSRTTGQNQREQMG